MVKPVLHVPRHVTEVSKAKPAATHKRATTATKPAKPKALKMKTKPAPKRPVDKPKPKSTLDLNALSKMNSIGK